MTDDDVKTIMEYALGDMEELAAANSAVAGDMIDYLGARGMDRCRQFEQAGQCGEEAMGTDERYRRGMQLWRRGRYRHVDDRPIPWFAPAAMYVACGASPRRKLTAAKASVAAMVEGGWWPQARLHAAGLAGSAVCKRCRKAVGTLYHRLADCSQDEAAEHRRACCPAWLRRQAEVRPWDPLFSRGCRPCLNGLTRPRR